MAAYQMGTRGLLVLWADNLDDTGLRERIQLMAECNAGPGWLVARDSLLDPRYDRRTRPYLLLGEKE